MAVFHGRDFYTMKPRALTPISKIFFAYWKSDRLMLLAIAAVLLLASISTIAGPYLFSRLVNLLPKIGVAKTLVWAFVLYSIVMGVSSALQQTVQYLALISAEKLNYITGTCFFDRLLKKDAAFFAEHNTAEIQNASAVGREQLKILVQLGLIVLIPGSIQILLAFVMLGALIDDKMVAIVAVYGASYIAFTTLANRTTRSFLDTAVGADQESARFLGNLINAMETLRYFNSQFWMRSRFTSRAWDVKKSWRAFALMRIRFIGVLGLGLAVQFAVTFYLLLPRYDNGELTIGDIVLFNTLLLQLNTPFEMLGHFIDQIVKSHTALRPFTDFWAAPEESQDLKSSRFVPSEGRIVFEGVGFLYDNGRGVRNVSFIAARGTVTFLIGETGAGKSTVLKLALKSMKPASGRILIDGTDLIDINRVDWYAAVGVVPQDVVLLNDSLAENILLGRPRDEQRLRLAARKAAILSFIENLQEGFETSVGERGLKLSGGERQRIAIARALYMNPAILFLDEPSSALDKATETAIMKHIRALSHDVTVLVITHRAALIENTDNVIDLVIPGDTEKRIRYVT